jgi:predicted amidophosphoribosyltransferase
MSEKLSLSRSFAPMRKRGRMGRFTATSHHPVVCAYCANAFDLFAASWCLDAEEPSKVCPHCQRCMCQHPAYGEPHFWGQAPLGFQRQGFQRLFLYYL